MAHRNPGLTSDPLFVAVTRPPMRWGVTFTALLVNLVVTIEVFLLTKNLLTLLIAIPIHGVCALLCLRDPRYFDLLFLWGRTRVAAYSRNHGVWRGSSYSPLEVEPPGASGRRRQAGTAHVAQVRPAGIGSRP